MKIFRRIRHNMLKNNKITAYLLYAIGEIFLVMIGILLALQVNNWNEKRKNKSELQSILNTIKYDLETDTLVAGQVSRLYDTLKVKSNIIINKQLKKRALYNVLFCCSNFGYIQGLIHSFSNYQKFHKPLYMDIRT